MPQNFLYPQRDQPMLMPLDMREWLPEDDLVFVVPARWPPWTWAGSAAGTGPMVTGAASGPEMMVALLLYGYCQGERSSRVIESGACGTWPTG